MNQRDHLSPAAVIHQEIANVCSYDGPSRVQFAEPDKTKVG